MPKQKVPEPVAELPSVHVEEQQGDEEEKEVVDEVAERRKKKREQHPSLLKKGPPVDKNLPVIKNSEKHSARWIQAQKVKRGIATPKHRNQAAKNLKYSSHAYFNNLWAEAQVDFRDILKDEKKRGTVSGTDRKKMFGILSQVYYRM